MSRHLNRCAALLGTFFAPGTALVLLGAISQAAIPAEAQKAIDQLVQEEKYDQALTQVEGLLTDKPDDAELKTLRRNIVAAMPKTAAAPIAGKVSKLDMAELRLIAKDAQTKAEGSAERGKLLGEFLEKSAAIVKQDQSLMELWTFRAAAALELNKPKDAWEAGQALLKLGADKGDNEQALTVLASLKRKGWLVEDYAAVTAAAEKTIASEKAEKERKFREALTGSWKRSNYIDDVKDETTLTFSFDPSGNTMVGYENSGGYGYNGADKKSRTSLTIQAPGQAEYRERTAGYSFPDRKYSGSTKVSLQSWMTPEKHCFHFDIKGKAIRATGIDVDGNQLQPFEQEVGQSQTYFLDEEGGRMILLDDDEAKLSREELLKRMSKIDESQRTVLKRK